jgi:hypothetical protein
MPGHQPRIPSQQHPSNRIIDPVPPGTPQLISLPLPNTELDGFEEDNKARGQYCSENIAERYVSNERRAQNDGQRRQEIPDKCNDFGWLLEAHTEQSLCDVEQEVLRLLDGEDWGHLAVIGFLCHFGCYIKIYRSGRLNQAVVNRGHAWVFIGSLFVAV